MSDWKCWAGRKAFNMGNPMWRDPCDLPTKHHHIVTDPLTPGAPVIELCDYHYHDAEHKGLIDVPNPTPEYEALSKILRPELKRLLDG